jgi:hypothetical protein
VVANQRDIANGFHPTSAEEIERHVLAKTGSKSIANEVVAGWRMAQAMSGEKVT